MSNLILRFRSLNEFEIQTKEISKLLPIINVTPALCPTSYNFKTLFNLSMGHMELESYILTKLINDCTTLL